VAQRHSESAEAEEAGRREGEREGAAASASAAAPTLSHYVAFWQDSNTALRQV
jgi:phage protein D